MEKFQGDLIEWCDFLNSFLLFNVSFLNAKIFIELGSC